MRLFISFIVIVAVVAAVGLLTGRYGAGLTLTLIVLLGAVIEPVGRVLVQTGWLNWLVVVFWLNVIAFAAPAYVLYLARRWLGRGYAPALSVWAVLYLSLMLSSGRLTDWP